MKIESNVSLLPYNTFHIETFADYFVSIRNENELLEVLDTEIAKSNPIFIIGGGSNILLTQDVHGLVLLNEIKGIEKIYEDDASVRVRFQSGENWHQCVCWSLEQNLGGIENLSLIPGTIGAAPIQNIGAYGVELNDVFFELEAIHLQTKKRIRFDKAECAFGYRNSIFKNTEKGKYFIVSVTLQLSKHPILKTDYGTIQEELQKIMPAVATIKTVSDAVIRIRQSKLPDPNIVGNAGSFFKNPVISKEAFVILQKRYPSIPFYESDAAIKIPAAWLIEQAHPEGALSWKGFTEKNYGVHPRQALCLVNYSDASGADIFNLSERIITSVQQAFNIVLEREVNIW